MTDKGQWRRTRLKFVADLEAGGTPAVDVESYWAERDDGIAWVTISDMTRSSRVASTSRTLTPKGLAASRLSVGQPGTLLLSMYASLGTLATLEIPAAWNQAILGITPKAGADSRFLRYALMALQPSLRSLARSSTQDNLNGAQVGNLALYGPSRETQAEIGVYLDQECARIELLLAHLTTLRHEAKIAAQQAGRARILEAGWPLAPIKHYARTGTGHTPSRSQPELWVQEDCVVPWFTLADVNQIRVGRRWVVETTVERLSERGIAESSARRHPVGTVLLSRTASVGFSAVMGVEMAVSQDFMTWTCGPNLDPFYLLITLRALQPELRGLMHGSTHQTIYMPDLHALRVPLPPLAEQHVLVQEARARSDALGPLDDELDAMTLRLAEYRDALITEAVTGKLDVAKLAEARCEESAHAAMEGDRPEVLSA